MKTRGWIGVRLVALVALMALALNGTAVSAAPAIDEPGEGDKVAHHFCADPELVHPVAQALAEYFEMEDPTFIMDWYCDGMGFGQIMLALKTAELTDGEPADYLMRRTDGEGWGQIWRDLELIGKPEEAGPPAEPPGKGEPPIDPPGHHEPPVEPPGYGEPPIDPPGRGEPPVDPPGHHEPPVDPPGYGEPPIDPPGYGEPPVEPPGHNAPPIDPPGYGEPPMDPPGSGRP